MIEMNKVTAKIVIRCDKSCEKNGKIEEIILNSKMFRSNVFAFDLRHDLIVYSYTISLHFK